MSERRRRWRVGALIAGVSLSLVVVRVLWSSRVQWREAEAHLVAGDEIGAIDRYGRAARLYAPGSPWCARSLVRLEELALGDERAGKPEPALSAWRELRASILATRSFYTPSPERLARANEHIARLAADTESPTVDPGADRAARERWHAARLAESDAPSVPFTLLALLGLGAWIGCAVGFLRHALDDEDRLVPAPALRWSLGVVLGFAAFLVGLAFA